MSPAPKHSPEQQQRLILDAAEYCIEQSSLLDFTMAAIAKRAGVSIGSLYKHVQSKEDVLVALGSQINRNFAERVKQVLALPLNTPQRLLALALMNPLRTQRYSFEQHLNALLNCEAILKRASAGWLGQLYRESDSIYARFNGLWQQAATSGELDLEASNATIDEINSAVWSLYVGFAQVLQHLSLQHQPQPSQLPYPLAPEHIQVRAFIRLLNSYSWQQNIRDADIPTIIELLDQQGLR
ncbi:MAG: TetR/AcrR family transcriptional regulator [Cellvibrionaceae bacterium]|nr:TetR/AcrR family transcriptional regulator [Cellvibrionaceae bacterium]